MIRFSTQAYYIHHKHNDEKDSCPTKMHSHTPFIEIGIEENGDEWDSQEKIEAQTRQLLALVRGFSLNRVLGSESATMMDFVVWLSQGIEGYMEETGLGGRNVEVVMTDGDNKWIVK